MYSRYLFFIPILYIIFVYLINTSFFLKYIDKYFKFSCLDSIGSKKLKEEINNLILDIKNEMHIKETIHLRKMNSSGMKIYGYFNAIACFPLFLKYLPINKPYIFVNEGFFELLSLEEKRFLIGHELIHIRDMHAYYLAIIFNFVFLLSLASIFNFNSILKNNLLIYIFIFIFIFLHKLSQAAYKRYNERMADILSMNILNSQAGCLKLIDRWKKDFNMKEDYNSLYERLFSDHPSLNERIKIANNKKI